MSSTQRLQQYIDSLKQARLQGAHQGLTPSTATPFRPAPRDVLELEFMDSLDQRMEQLERSLSTQHPRAASSAAAYDASGYSAAAAAADGSAVGIGGGIVSPAPAPTMAAALSAFHGSHSPQRAALLNQQLAASPALSGGSATGAQLGARRGFMWSTAQPFASRSFNAHVVPQTSLVFRVTLPFLRSTVSVLRAADVGMGTAEGMAGLSPAQQAQRQQAITAASSSECASFLVHVADLSQTGDDLLWHVVAQARIRFPDLMNVGGFEWTPGAASSLLLFALCAQDAANWAAAPQLGAPRVGGAFLHYDSATPLHRYQPIAEALKRRRDKPSSATELMGRALRDLPAQAPDVEVFVLLKTMVPGSEMSEVSLRRGLALQ